MPGRRLRRAVARPFAYLVVVAVLGAVLAGAARAGGGPQGPWAVAGAGATTKLLGQPFPSAKVASPANQPDVTQVTRSDRARQRVRTERLQSAEAREERLLSRQRFRRLSAAQAESVARRAHSEWIEEPAWSPPETRPGERLGKHFGDHAVQVKRDGADTAAIAVSATPLMSDVGSGERAPVDLALQRQADGFVPKNPVVPSRLPQRLGDGIEFPSEDIVLHSAGAENVTPTQVGGKLLYANVHTDTDFFAEPLPTGVETYYQLRSPAAPEAFEVRAGAGHADRFETAADGSARMLRDGKPVLAVAPPVARDAQGTDVPVRYAERDGALVIEVAHRGADLAYPVMIDPWWWALSHGFDWNDGGTNQYFEGWVRGGAAAGWDGFACIHGATNCYVPGYWLRSHPGWHGHGTYTSLFNPVANGPGGTGFAFRVDWRNLNLDSNANTCSSIGLSTADQLSWISTPGGTNLDEPWTSCVSMNNYTVSTCANATCGATPAPPVGTMPMFNLFMNGSGNRANYNHAWVGNPVVYLTDNDWPTVTGSAINGIGTAANGYWTQNNVITGHFTVSDPGLGLPYTWGSDSAPNGTESAMWNDATCTYASLCSKGATYAFEIHAAAGDSGVFTMPVRDVVDHYAYFTTPPIRYDWQAPSATYEGALPALNGRTTAKYAEVIVNSKDGHWPSDMQSGVKSVQLLVDGQLADQKTNVCATFSCTAVSMLGFDPSQYQPGNHAVKVVTTDWSGRTVESPTWTIGVGVNELTRAQEGKRVARYVELGAKRAGGQAGAAVRFEYRRAGQTTWQTINPNFLKTRRGAALTGTPATTVPYDGTGRTEALVWDAAAELRDGNGRVVGGPVHIRAVDSANAARIGQDVLVRLEPSGIGTDDARTTIGPMSVDAVTGNATLTATDVVVAAPKTGLSLSRSYNSRDVATDVPRPLGPGWSMAALAANAEADFIKVLDRTVSTDPLVRGPYVALRTAEGADIPFAEATATKYVPEPGFERYSLTREFDAAGTVRFVLKDNDSNETIVYGRNSGTAAGEYELVSISGPVSMSTTSYAYEPVPGGPGTRVKRIIAPAAAGITCSATQLDQGCRALDLDWTTLPGVSGYRLSGVRLRAWNPSTAAMDNITVATYDYDAAGRLKAVWDPRISPALKTEYEYDGTSSRVTKITPPGELPWTLTYAPATHDPVDDGGRLSKVSRAALAPATGVAEQAIYYDLPVSGPNVPWDLSATAGDATGQTDLPVQAAAVFPPDVTASSANLDRAIATFVNPAGREVNEFRPSTNPADPYGKIATTEYDDHGNVRRELSAGNRATALASTTVPTAALAKRLSTERTWATNTGGSRLTEVLEPEQQIKLPDGNAAVGRQRTQMSYDAEAPATSIPFNLPTQVVEDVLGAPTVPAHTTNSVWDFTKRLHTQTIVDPAGLNLRETSVFDAAGLETEHRSRGDVNGTKAGTVETIRYTRDSSSPVAACQNKPHWAGMPCVVRPKVQPATGTGRPQLPSSTITYDVYLNVASRQDSGAGETRTETFTYDGAGRQYRRAVTGTVGAALPVTEWEYAGATGVLSKTKTLTSGGATDLVVERTYDTLGRLRSYTDAHGARTETEYDLLDRVTTTTQREGSAPSSSVVGSQQWQYDTRTGLPSSLIDSDVGTVTFGFDRDERQVTQTLGTSGLRIDTVYDAFGAMTGRKYVKTSCTTDCTWYESSATDNGHGLWADKSDTFGSADYRYDKAQRLIEVDDRLSPTQCVQRKYGYDANSNRVTQSAWNAAATCGSGSPTTVGHAYDDADRLTDPGVVYDAFGRTATLPAANAGGHTLTSSYFVNDRVQTLTQNGRTLELTLEPEEREHTRQHTGQTASAQHYSDDQDAPAWSKRGTTIERDIKDGGGDLLAIRSGSDVKLQLSDLHGDVVAEIPNQANPPRPTALPKVDEFGVPPVAPAAPSVEFIGKAVTALTSAGDALVINRPSNTQSGDLLLAELSPEDSAHVTVPSGWTPVSNGGDSLTVVYWKVAGTSEPTSYTFALSSVANHGGAIKTYRNVDTSQGLSALTSGGTRFTPSTTAAVNGTKVSLFGAAQFGGSGFYGLYGADWAEDWSLGIITTAYGSRDAVSSTAGPFNAGQTIPSYEFPLNSLIDEDVAGAVMTLLEPPSPAAVGAESRYRFLGAKRRQTSLPSGVITMGARVYVPQTGRFLQTDPIRGGSANAYDYANQDPVNQLDLDGESSGFRERCRRFGAVVGIICSFANMDGDEVKYPQGVPTRHPISITPAPPRGGNPSGPKPRPKPAPPKPKPVPPAMMPKPAPKPVPKPPAAKPAPKPKPAPKKPSGIHKSDRFKGGHI